MIKILYITGTKIYLDFILPTALSLLTMNVLTVNKRGINLRAATIPALNNANR